MQPSLYACIYKSAGEWVDEHKSHTLYLEVCYGCRIWGLWAHAPRAWLKWRQGKETLNLLDVQYEQTKQNQKVNFRNHGG